MAKESTTRFAAVVLALLTVTAATFAWINFSKERSYQLPYDGVWWLERGGRLTADKLDPEGPGNRAGVRAGDILVSVNDHAMDSSAALTRALYQAGSWTRANYGLLRQGVAI
jgi:S1-C subfamily serine protease